MKFKSNIRKILAAKSDVIQFKYLNIQEKYDVVNIRILANYNSHV